MAGLDFRRATNLFLGSSEELGRALDLDAERVRRYREHPGDVPPDVLARLGDVLIERGRGMARVGEMLRETAEGG